jgi:hypothetical protein
MRGMCLHQSPWLRTVAEQSKSSTPSTCAAVRPRMPLKTRLPPILDLQAAEAETRALAATEETSMSV